MHKEHHGFLWGILAAFTNATMAVFIKLASAIPSETLVFVRFILGFLCLFPIAYHKKISISFSKIPYHLVRGLAGIASLYCYFYAVKMLPLVNAVTLASTAPLFMPFVVLFWIKELVSKLRFIAVAIGFMGVIVMMRPTGQVLEWASLIAIAGSLCSAIAFMGIRLLSKSMTTETILTYYFLICTILSLFPMLFTWKPISNPMDWVYLLAIALLSLIYQYSVTRAFTHAPATKASTLTYLGVVFSGLAGWWFFGEIPTYWVLGGVVLIIASALLALFDKTPPHKIC